MVKLSTNIFSEFIRNIEQLFKEEYIKKYIKYYKISQIMSKLHIDWTILTILKEIYNNLPLIIHIANENFFQF
jgi:hypothetical protein